MSASPVVEPECCPKFDPQRWNDKVHTWDHKHFVIGHVRTFFWMPLNFGSVVRRLDRRIREAGGTLEQNVCLSDHTSRWNMDIYLAVDREVPGAENAEMSGTMFSRVYEGPLQQTAAWCRDFDEESERRGLRIRKQYMWYTTCPKCAKKYGKNYMAIVGEVGQN